MNNMMRCASSPIWYSSHSLASCGFSTVLVILLLSMSFSLVARCVLKPIHVFEIYKWYTEVSLQIHRICYSVISLQNSPYKTYHRWFYHAQALVSSIPSQVCLPFSIHLFPAFLLSPLLLCSVVLLYGACRTREGRSAKI